MGIDLDTSAVKMLLVFISIQIIFNFY